MSSMNPSPRHSLTRRALARIGVMAGLGLVISTAVTYRIVYQAMEETRLEMLGQDAVENARREEGRFMNAETTHRLLKEVFLERLARGPSAEDDAWFDAHCRRDDDGAVRSRRELVDPSKQATTWIRVGVEITGEMKWLVRLSQNLCETYMRVLQDQMESLYITSPLEFNSGIAPEQPEWVWEAAADFDQNAHEWGRLGGKDENPHRVSLWTGMVYDTQSIGLGSEKTPQGKPYVTLCTPIDVESRHVLTLHSDTYFMGLVKLALQHEKDGLRRMVLRDDGQLIAHPELSEELTTRGEPLFAEQTGNESLRNIHAAVQGSQRPLVSGYDAAGGVYFVAHRLRGPDWWFISLLPKAQLEETAFRSAQWVLWIGLASLAFVLGTLAVMLRREIATPLQALLGATRRLASGDTGAGLEVTRPDELGELAAAFNDMTRQVAGRDAELRAEKAGLETRVAERTAELREALDRARELTRLKSNFVSMVSHEYRTPLGVIVSSADILSRYLERLEPAECAEHLQAIQSSARRMARMMEDVLLVGRLDGDQQGFQPDDLHLVSFCRRLIEEQHSVTAGRWPFQLDLDETLPLALADGHLLRHILTNLLSNAAKYSPPGSLITLSLRRNGEVAEFRVADEGMGIPAEDREHLYTAFHRGRNTPQIPGTGLGLVIVKRCVDRHGGTIAFESEEGRGATFTVRLPVFPAS